jgi:hypothetical protein
LKNLEISNFNLESDLTWSEFVITEYYQVLIDSWRFGKPGASVNLTSRCSFMKDYSELGFQDFHTIKDLVKILNKDLDWTDFISKHNSGVRRFNKNQEEWNNLK